MKKWKTLLIMTLCFAFVLTTTPVTPNNDVNPCGHYKKDAETF